LPRTRDRERALEIFFGLRRTELRQLQRDLTAYAIDFRFVLAFFGGFHHAQCFPPSQNLE
jgi:hypothetical protein